MVSMTGWAIIPLLLNSLDSFKMLSPILLLLSSFGFLILFLPQLYPSYSILLAAIIPIALAIFFSISALVGAIRKALATFTIVFLLMISFLSPWIVSKSYMAISGEKEIQTVANKISQNLENQEKIAKKTVRWIQEVMTNSYSIKDYFLDLHLVSRPPFVLRRGSGASEILFYKFGSCREYTVIFEKLARLNEIKVREVRNPGEDHRWAEIWIDNRWIHVDPSNGYYDKPNVYENGWEKEISYVYAIAENGSWKDITTKYTDTGRMTVNVTKNGKNVENAKITIKSRYLMLNISRYESPRRIVHKSKYLSNKTNQNGTCTFRLGGNSYVVTVNVGNKKDKKIVSLNENSVENLNFSF